MYKAIILATLLVSAYSGAANLRSDTVKPNLTGILELVGGVLDGFLLDIGAEDIVNCLTGAYSIGDEIYEGVQEFEKKSISGMVAGLKDVGEALKTIPSAITTCKTAYAGAAKEMEDSLAVFKNPLSVVYHIGEAFEVDGKEIITEIQTGVSDWNSGKWFDCGKQFGMALFKFVNPDTTVEITAADILDLVGGVLNGFLLDIGAGDIENCLGDTYNIGNDFYQAVLDFKKKDTSGIVAGLKEVGYALETIPSAITSCKSAYENAAKELTNALAVFKSPLSVVYHMGEALVVDGKEIYTEVNTGVTDWDGSKYFDCGEEFGKALFKFINP